MRYRSHRRRIPETQKKRIHLADCSQANLILGGPTHTASICPPTFLSKVPVSFSGSYYVRDKKMWNEHKKDDHFLRSSRKNYRIAIFLLKLLRVRPRGQNSDGYCAYI